MAVNPTFEDDRQPGVKDTTDIQGDTRLDAGERGEEEGSLRMDEGEREGRFRREKEVEKVEGRFWVDKEEEGGIREGKEGEKGGLREDKELEGGLWVDEKVEGGLRGDTQLEKQGFGTEEEEGRFSMVTVKDDSGDFVRPR